MKNLTFLACINFSVESDMLVKKMIDFCEKNGSKLYVLHVVEESFFSSKKSLEEIREKTWEMLNKNFPTFAKEDYFCVKGVFHIEALELAEKLFASMIVINDKQQTTLIEDLFLSSHTKTLIRNSHLPVLVVKNEDELSFENITMPTDLSTESKRAIWKIHRLFPESRIKLCHIYNVLFESRLGFYGFDDCDKEEYARHAKNVAEVESRNFVKSLDINEKSVFVVVKKGKLTPYAIIGERQFCQNELFALHTTGNICFFAFELLASSTQDVLICRF